MKMQAIVPTACKGKIWVGPSALNDQRKSWGHPSDCIIAQSCSRPPSPPGILHMVCLICSLISYAGSLDHQHGDMGVGILEWMLASTE